MPYDRHETLAGVSGANPLLVPRNFAASAVNRSFRYDTNAPRLPIQQIELTFDSEEERIWFAGGNFQGATFYHSYPSFLSSCLIASIAGRIFKIVVKGRSGHVSTLFEGNDPVLQHVWFAQGFEWLVIQDGYAKPILWNGLQAARRSGENEVPTGSVMATIHGRLVVASADGTNQIAVGDIVYGEDQTSTADIIKFTEIQYWAAGGAFGAPVYVGDITGLSPMAYLDTGTGQNELVVLGTNGAVSMDLSRPREQWLDGQIMRISLIGGGCVSSHSLTQMNGDLFFRSDDGIRSFRNSRSEFQQQWSQTPISSDVRRWIDYDAPDLLQFNSQVSWGNFLFSTCSPMLEGANNPYAGFHRYHRGFVVMDAQPQSSTVRTGVPLWYGMWTGIRPTQFVTGRIDNEERCFAFSYDQDGRNRLYEIRREGFDLFGGGKRRMFSMYTTGTLGTIERTSSNFELKTLQGGELELSALKEEVRLELAVRPDNSPCFIPHYETSIGCDCQSRPCFSPSQPSQARIVFGGIEKKCDPSTGLPLKTLHHWQARVKLTGNVTVEGLAYRFEVEKNPTTCGATGGSCAPIFCCDGSEYSYHIAPAGSNDEVPNIPVPSDTPVVYQGTAKYTANCPAGSTGSPVTVTGTATSTISQSDADLKALQQAVAVANSQLQCSTCGAATLLTFSVNNSSYDLFDLFNQENPNFEGRPWRMIDQETLAIYANGITDGDGVLQISFAQETGDTTFNPDTFIFTDASGTDVPVAIQVACPGPDGQTWPDISDYNPA